MKDQMKVPDQLKIFLKDAMGSKHSRKRALLLIEKNPDISDDDKQVLRDIIKDKARTDSVPTNLSDALKVEGVDEYIASMVEEAVEEETKELSDKLKASEAQITKLEEGLPKEVLIDSIIGLSLALRDDTINLEKVDESIKKLRDELKDKSITDLKTRFDELSSTMGEKFKIKPTEKVDREDLVKDDKDPKETKNQKGETQDEEKDPPGSLSDVAELFLTKKKDK